MKKEINFNLNGEMVIAEVRPQETLLSLLREGFGLKSPKCGCDMGDCGACTVMIEGRTVRSCLVLAIEVDGMEVLTLEGLMKNGPTKLQTTFIEKNSFQCGFCAPGIVLAATELLTNNKTPSKTEVKEAISGNLCRCTGYHPIIDAIMETLKTDKMESVSFE